MSSHDKGQKLVGLSRPGVRLPAGSGSHHATVALSSIHALIEQHVLAVGRLHGPSRQIWLGKIACRATDDTTVPLLARVGTKTVRLWTYVRYHAPFNGGAPPAALFYFSSHRDGRHPEKHLARWRGTLQSDVSAGDNGLFVPDREPGPVTCAFCWRHGKRMFFELADIRGNLRKNKPAHGISPIALETVQKIHPIFSVERKLNGLSAVQRVRSGSRRWSMLCIPG